MPDWALRFAGPETRANVHTTLDLASTSMCLLQQFSAPGQGLQGNPCRLSFQEKELLPAAGSLVSSHWIGLYLTVTCFFVRLRFGIDSFIIIIVTLFYLIFLCVSFWASF